MAYCGLQHEMPQRKTRYMVFPTAGRNKNFCPRPCIRREEGGGGSVQGKGGFASSCGCQLFEYTPDRPPLRTSTASRKTDSLTGILRFMATSPTASSFGRLWAGGGGASVPLCAQGSAWARNRVHPCEGKSTDKHICGGWGGRAKHNETVKDIPAAAAAL